LKENLFYSFNNGTFFDATRLIIFELAYQGSYGQGARIC